MKLLCGFQPIDPGVDRRTPHCMGWTLIDMSPLAADRLLNLLGAFARFRHGQPSYVSLVVDYNIEEAGERPQLTHCIGSQELFEAWRAHRVSDATYATSQFARLYDLAAFDLQRDAVIVDPYVHNELVIEPHGVWYRIYMPTPRISVQTPLLTRQLITQAASTPE